jgi:short-subunit dehydrogenase
VKALVLCPGFTRTEFQERANYEVKGLAARFWQTPEEVVETTLSALDRDSGICVPGWQNKVAAGATHLAPRRLLPRVAGMISGQV